MLTIKEAEEMLKKEYHLDNFTYLMSDILLPDYCEDKHEVTYNNHAFSSVIMLGSSNKCDITVFEVYLSEGVQNRRVAITQEMFRIMRGLRINNAVVAFVNASKHNYRISLLTSKYEFNGDKIVKILSNPRRLSYSLGYGTKTKTAYKFLIEKGKVNTFDELVSRFSVEVVNKQFYSEIATAFTELVGGERNGRKYEKTLGLYGVTDHNKYVEFAVRLIGRIMFCWFLREKRSEKGIPLVPDSMLDINTIKEGNYYHKVLEPLFFELLNTNQNRRKKEFKIGEYNWVPYLNGGLFNPQSDDYYRYDAINHCGSFGLVNVPDEWFIRLYSVLGEYNFTVDENTAYDIELSIDPEMLGRIFENLLAEINPETGENAKKSTGSFYTPREIVDYMVDSSLCEYLRTKTSIEEGKLKSLISYYKEDDVLYFFSKQEKIAIIDALYSITTLDPACGSGAFPIGMLQKIVYILQVLDPGADLWFDKATENVGILLKKEFEKKFNAGSLNYIRKLSVIQNSIFGVDIQPIAIEISRLRCFLSLIIEEKVDDIEENRGINALPNLDFKFIIANSLFSLDDGDRLSLFENVGHIEKLKAVREEYFNADSDRRSELKLEFSQIQQDMLLNTIQNLSKHSSKKYSQLYSWKPFSNESTDWFDSDWMFGIKNGFDVVIGNPPYVGTGSRGTARRMSNETKEYYRKHYPNSAEYKINLYALFMELGINLSCINGVSSFIVPDSFLLGMYFSKIRKYILDNCIIKHIAILGSDIFSACVGYSVIYLLKKEIVIDPQMTIINANKKGGFDDCCRFSYPQEYSKKLPRYRFRVFFDSRTKDIVDKIENGSLPLKTYYTGHTGVRSKIGQKNIISKQKLTDTYQKGIISGSQVTPFKVLYEGDWLNIDSAILNAGGFDESVIENPKILIRQTADTLIAAYDNNGLYHLNNVHSFSPNTSDSWDIRYILALLNSHLMRWYYETLANEKGRPMPQTDIDSLEALPIKYSEDNANVICSLVSGVLTSDNNVDIEKYFAEINRIIYIIYGLSSDEIDYIENAFK